MPSCTVAVGHEKHSEVWVSAHKHCIQHWSFILYLMGLCGILGLYIASCSDLWEHFLEFMFFDIDLFGINFL